MKKLIVEIKDSLTKAIKSVDPNVDVFYEEIKRTDAEQGLSMGDTWYYITLLPAGNITVDQYYTEKSFLIDIAYHEKSESNTAYLIKFAELDKLFRPAFSFGDRTITVLEAEERIADHTLHYRFPLSFRHSEEAEQSFGMMGELGAALIQGGN